MVSGLQNKFAVLAALVIGVVIGVGATFVVLEKTPYIASLTVKSAKAVPSIQRTPTTVQPSA